MKYLVILFALLFIFSCGNDTVVNNGGDPNSDFDIYLGKFSQQSLRYSSYTIKSDGTGMKLFNDSMAVGSSSRNNKILMAGFDTTATSLKVYCANYDGTNLTVLPTPGYQPVYFDIAGTGDKVLFTTDLGNFMCVINTDGTGLTQISTGILGSEDVPKFSPDGKLIAFFESIPNVSTGLYIINPEGTYKKLLKDSIYKIVGFHLDWSPDGSKIIYQNNLNNSGNIKICSIDTSGNNYTEITEGWSPAWSPIGSKICYMVNVNQGMFDLFIMNPDGTGITNITNTNTTYEANQKWSRDGMKLLHSTQALSSNVPHCTIYDLNSNTSFILADSVYGAIWK